MYITDFIYTCVYNAFKYICIWYNMYTYNTLYVYIGIYILNVYNMFCFVNNRIRHIYYRCNRIVDSTLYCLNS